MMAEGKQGKIKFLQIGGYVHWTEFSSRQAFTLVLYRCWTSYEGTFSQLGCSPGLIASPRLTGCQNQRGVLIITSSS